MAQEIPRSTSPEAVLELRNSCCVCCELREVRSLTDYGECASCTAGTIYTLPACVSSHLFRAQHAQHAGGRQVSRPPSPINTLHGVSMQVRDKRAEVQATQTEHTPPRVQQYNKHGERGDAISSVTLSLLQVAHSCK